MKPETDQELLKRYAERGDGAAFAAVVRAHLNLVYAVALRLVGGDATLAEEVAQGVFTALARQAGWVSGHATPVGWLHTTTRHLASKAIRGERRRKWREHQAFTMQIIDDTPEINWAQIKPVLDEAVGGLSAVDREALILRFFEGKSQSEVGMAIGATEEAARKRINRALEKLRGQFARRGITATVGFLAAVMADNPVQAAPMGLADRLTAHSIEAAGGAAAGGAFAYAFLAFLMSTKNKIIVAGVVLLLLAGMLAVDWRGTPEAAPDRGPSAPAPVKAAVPKVVVSAQVAAPVVMPETPVASTPAQVAVTGGATPAMDPRVEITTAMTDYAHLLEVGDYVSAADNYMQLPPNISGQELIEMMQKNPDFPKTVQMLMEATKAAQTSPPTYNEAGDVVTYELSPPVDGKVRVRWKQIAGRWMVDGYD